MPAGELKFPAVPQVIGGGRVLPSPSQFYVTGEDRLRLVVANSLVGVAVGLHWRTATLEGDTKPTRNTHTPATDRSVTTQDYELGVGSLLNVTVFAAAGAPRIGQTYVMVQLVRGFGTAAIVLGTLLAGYVTATQALGFPGSPIVNSLEGGGYARFFAGTDPAPGAQVSETVPVGARWDLHGFECELTTDATVAVRRPHLTIDNGTTVYFRSANPGTTPATNTQRFFWAAGSALETVIAPAAPLGGLPIPFPLLAGHRIVTGLDNGQVGDNWTTPIVLVREWLEV